MVGSGLSKLNYNESSQCVEDPSEAESDDSNNDKHKQDPSVIKSEGEEAEDKDNHKWNH